MRLVQLVQDMERRGEPWELIQVARELARRAMDVMEATPAVKERADGMGGRR